MKKECSKCKQIKLLEEYGNLKKGKNGKCSYCKECAKKEHREWILKNQEHVRERSGNYVRERWKQHRELKSQQYINELLKNGIRRYIVDKKGRSYEDILGAPFDIVRAHIEQNFKEGMKWENHGEWHIDHIVPLSSGSTRTEWLTLNHYTNLQPLWAKDNLKKGARMQAGQK